MKILFLFLLLFIASVECAIWSTSETTYLYHEEASTFAQSLKYCKSVGMRLVYFDKVSDYDQLWNATQTLVWTDIHKVYDPETKHKEWYSHGSLVEWYSEGSGECAAIGDDYLESKDCDSALPFVCRANYCQGRDDSGKVSDLDPRVCNGNGHCVSNDYCVCDDGYYGEACQYNLSGIHCNGISKDNADTVCNGRGVCVEQDQCQCSLNYTGQFCENPICYGYSASDPRACAAPNGESGYCTAPDQCDCMSHKTRYTGHNCSTPLCGDTGRCMNDGACTGPDHCDCKDGYYGDTCSEFSCFGKNKQESCNGHGSCISLDSCSCYSHWFGRECEIPYCGASDGCGKNGECIAPFECLCYDGYHGLRCSEYECFGYQNDDKAVCNGFGECSAPDLCRCNDGHSGRNCSVFQCYGIDASNETVCGGHGRCTSLDRCDCESGYSGSECEKPVCFSKAENESCSKNGICIAPNQCSCFSGYGGDECQSPICFNRTGSAACSGNGECVGFNECQCYPGFKGNDCSQIMIIKSRGLLTTVSVGGGTCSSTSQCNNHGTCKSSKCVCDAGYGGSLCDTQVCGDVPKSDPDVCGGSKRGYCTDTGSCSCYDGNSGSQCSTFSCGTDGDGKVCYDRGSCVYAAMCRCNPPYTKADCSGTAKCEYKTDISSTNQNVAQNEIDRVNTLYYNQISGTGTQACSLLEPFMIVKSSELFDSYGRCNFRFDPDLLNTVVHDNQKQLAYTLLSSDSNTIDTMCPSQSDELGTKFLLPYDYSEYTAGGHGRMTGRINCLVNLNYTQEDMKNDQYKFNSIASAVKYCSMDTYKNVVVLVSVNRKDIQLTIDSALTKKDLYIRKSVIVKKRTIGDDPTESDIEIVLDDGVYEEDISVGSNLVSSSTSATCDGSGYRSIKIRAKNTGKAIIKGAIKIFSPMNTLSISGVSITAPDNQPWFQNSAFLYNFAMSYSSITCKLTSTSVQPATFRVPRKGLSTPSWLKEYEMEGFLLYSSTLSGCNGINVQLFEDTVECGDTTLSYSVQYMKNVHINHKGIILSIHTLDRSDGDTDLDNGARRVDFVNIASNEYTSTVETPFKNYDHAPVNALYSIYMEHAKKWISPLTYAITCNGIGFYPCYRTVYSIHTILFSGNIVRDSPRTTFAAINYIGIITRIESNDIDTSQIRQVMDYTTILSYYCKSVIGIWSNPDPYAGTDDGFACQLAIINNRFNTTGINLDATKIDNYVPDLYDLVRVGNLHVTGYNTPSYYDLNTNVRYNGYINTDGSWYYPPYQSGYAYSIRKMSIEGNYCTTRDTTMDSCVYRSAFNITTTHGEHARFVYYETYGGGSFSDTDTGLQSIPYSFMLKNGRTMTGLVYDFYIHSTVQIPPQFDAVFGASVRCNTTCKGSCNACIIDKSNIPDKGVYMPGSSYSATQYCFDIVVFSKLARSTSMCKHNTLLIAESDYSPTVMTFSSTSTMYVETYRTENNPNSRASIVYSDSAIIESPETKDHPIQLGSSTIQFKNIDFWLKKENSDSIYRQALFYVGPVGSSVVSSVTFINCGIYGKSGYPMSIFDDYSSYSSLRELYIYDSIISGWSWSGITGGSYKFESLRNKYYNMGAGAISTKATARTIIKDNEMYAVAHSTAETAVVYSESCTCSLGCSIDNNTIVGLLSYIRLAKDKVTYDYFASPALIYLKAGYMTHQHVTDNIYYGSQIGLKYENMRAISCSRDQLRAMRIANPIISGTKADIACSDTVELYCSGFCINRTEPPSICVIDPNADPSSADYGYNIFLDFDEAIYGCATSGVMNLLIRPGTYDQSSDILAFTSSTQTSLLMKVDGPCGSVNVIASSITIDASAFYGGVHIECINFYYYKDTPSSSSIERTFVSISSSNSYSPTIEIYRCTFASQLALAGTNITVLKTLLNTYQAPMKLLEIECYASSLTGEVKLTDLVFDTAWEYALTISTNILTMTSVTVKNVAEAALKVENTHHLTVRYFECTEYCGLWSTSSGRLSLVEFYVYPNDGDTIYRVDSILISLTDPAYQDKNPSPIRYASLFLGFASEPSGSTTGFTIYWRNLTLLNYPIGVRIDTTISKDYVMLNEPVGWIPLYDDYKRYMRELMVLNNRLIGISGSYIDVRHSSYVQDSVLNSEYTCNDLCPSDELASCSVNKAYSATTVGFDQIYFSSIQSAMYKCIRSPRIIRLVYQDQTEMNSESVNIVHDEVVQVDLSSSAIKEATIIIKGQANLFYPTYNITWSGGIIFKKSGSDTVYPYSNIRISENLNLLSSCGSFVSDESVVSDRSNLVLESLMFTRGDCQQTVQSPMVTLSSLFSSITLQTIYVKLIEEKAQVDGTRFALIDGGCISQVSLDSIQIDTAYYKSSNMITIRNVKSVALTDSALSGCSFGSALIEETFEESDLFSCVHISMCQYGSLDVRDNKISLKALDTVNAGDLVPYHKRSSNAYSCLSIHFLDKWLTSEYRELSEHLSSNACSGKPPLGIKLINYIVPTQMTDFPSGDLKYYVRNVSMNNPDIDAHRFDIIINSATVKDIDVHGNDLLYTSYNCLNQCSDSEKLPELAIVLGTVGGLAALIILLWVISIFTGKSLFGIVCCDAYNSKGARERYEEKRHDKKTIVIPMKKSKLRKRLNQNGQNLE